MEEILATNLVGPLLFARDVAEIMKKQKSGHIINMASVSGMIARKEGGMLYGLTKSGLIYVTKSLAKQYAPEVRVNAIAPGYTQTDLFLESHKADLSDVVQKIPLKKINSPDDIAQGAVYLCKAANITGHVLVIDGGSSI